MTTIITLLILLGLVGSPDEFQNMTQTQQDELIEIVIVDDINM